MSARWLIVLIFFFGCTEDEFPTGIYDYQVERLLTGGNEKIWSQVINSSNCADSIKLLIRVSDASVDSINISQLNPLDDCSGFDTLRLGNANASAPPDGIVFTDSLVFASGTFWIVEQVTSLQLRVRESPSTTIDYTSE